MKFIDLTGEKYNLLTVIRKTSKKDPQGRLLWECKCDCGNTTLVNSNNLKTGQVKSCGCLFHKYSDYSSILNNHKDDYRRLYGIWKNIKSRCTNTNDKSYNNYGGRGITIDSEWEKSFIKFAEWAYLHGYNNDLTIERINVNGNYSPENCTWTTLKNQARNRRSTLWITYQGETKSLAEWCEIYGTNYKRTHGRMRRGWDFEKAMFTPV